MRKPRGGQIRANRLIGPRKVLGEGDRRVPPRGEVVQRPTEAAQQPRGSGPLPSTPARARGSSVRATPSLRPPRILGTISLFYRKEDRGKGRLRGRLQLFFLILVWGFPIVAAGILFDVDQTGSSAAPSSGSGAPNGASPRRGERENPVWRCPRRGWSRPARRGRGRRMRRSSGRVTGSESITVA